MVQETAPSDPHPEPDRRNRIRRRIWRVAGLLLVILATIVGLLWSQRTEIADDFIARKLDELGLEASYRVVSIAPEVQVLGDIVVGDSQRPDATIARAEVRLRHGFWMPEVDSVRLSGVRVWGTITQGKPSFGALDPLIFTNDEEPFAFPAIDLTLTDAKALIEGDHGPIAASIKGSGRLDGGFSGEIGVVAPGLSLARCLATQTTLYGRLTIQEQRPSFAGPLRFARLECADKVLTVDGGAANLDLKADADMQGVRGEAALRLGRIGHTQVQLAAVSGTASLAFRDGNLNADFDLSAPAVETGAARLAALVAQGRLRTFDSLTRYQLEAELAGRGLQPQGNWPQALRKAELATAGTLVAPLLTRLRNGLAASLPGNSLSASLILRQNEGRLAVLVPEARLRGRGGESLLMISRAQLGFTDTGLPLFSGNFRSFGPDLPQIMGRMEQDATGVVEMRLRMADYGAGGARLALPDLRLRQVRGGALAIEGVVEADGPLPGGEVGGLVLPISARVSAQGEMVLWPSCVPMRFARLKLADLDIAGHSVSLCPVDGASIVRSNGAGWQVAAGIPELDLQGSLGETPVHIASGEVQIAWPGRLSVQDLNIALGDRGNVSRLAVGSLAADFGSDLAGTFAGMQAQLAAVPLDLDQGQGTWRMAGGTVRIEEGSFRLSDRQQVDRFKPLVARDAVLTLQGGVIRADFTLRHPASGTAVVDVAVEHNLSSTAGHAVLDVPDLVFAPGVFQPRDLSELAYGVVSLVSGSVRGSGQVAWTADRVTSSGVFSSDGLNFAAAFGPVAGARGTVEFTDLIGLTTAPGQQLQVAMINPGIEMNDGVITFSLVDGTRLYLENAEWPFMGGRLTMLPLIMNIGAPEERRYVFQISGLQAGRVIERLELNNLAASGTFDGQLPVVFDAMGNGKLDGGLLVARSPGGHVSYIGQLTYEDLSFVGNFAFQALRDLAFREMVVNLDGPLTGELVTRVRLDGVRQGATAQTNFLTKQLARLPIRLNVSVRAPFYQMASSMRSLYEPGAIRDPRGLGLIGRDGRALRGSVGGSDAPPPPQADSPQENPAANARTRDETPVQPLEREALP